MGTSGGFPSPCEYLPGFHLKYDYNRGESGEGPSSPGGQPDFVLERKYRLPGSVDVTPFQEAAPEKNKTTVDFSEAAGGDTERPPDCINMIGMFVEGVSDSDRDGSPAFAGPQAEASASNSSTTPGTMPSCRGSAAEARTDSGQRERGDTVSGGNAEFRHEVLNRGGGNEASERATSEGRLPGVTAEQGKLYTALESGGAESKWLVRNYNDGSYFTSISALLISRGEIVGDLETGADLTPQAQTYCEHLVLLTSHMSSAAGQPRHMEVTNKP